MEVTKWLKPSGCVSRIGDSASVQAVTRVNAEQALYEAFEVKHYLTAFFTGRGGGRVHRSYGACEAVLSGNHPGC
jgi:hypothetical protein